MDPRRTARGVPETRAARNHDRRRSTAPRATTSIRVSGRPPAFGCFGRLDRRAHPGREAGWRRVSTGEACEGGAYQHDQLDRPSPNGEAWRAPAPSPDRPAGVTASARCLQGYLWRSRSQAVRGSFGRSSQPAGRQHGTICGNARPSSETGRRIRRVLIGADGGIPYHPAPNHTPLGESVAKRRLGRALWHRWNGSPEPRQKLHNAVPEEALDVKSLRRSRSRRLCRGCGGVGVGRV
jgi:hypothetical protein